MHTISKYFDFCAGHALVHLPPEHKCSRLHGHNYRLWVWLTAPDEVVNQNAWVVDFGELSQLKRLIDEEYDHKFLASGGEPFLDSLRAEEVVPLARPTTAENLAEHFYFICQQFEWGPYVSKVGVSETPKTLAEYTP